MVRHDPNTPPIGRQPLIRRVTPSKANPWYGTIRDVEETHLAQRGGERFTLEQQRVMDARRLRLDAEVLVVKRQATHAEIWTPFGELPPVFAFECPVEGRRADGRVKVIATNGEAKFVMADGWAHYPVRNPFRNAL